MTNKHGDFNWYELMTADADTAAAFYGAVLGWTFKGIDQPDVGYRLFSSGPNDVGGMMSLTPDMQSGGARPAWIGYICADDVDATADAIKAKGGHIHMAPWDIPDVGRMAMAADPQGTPFYLMRGASDGTSHSFAATEPMVGHCAWNELASTNPAAAKAFYAHIFDWVQDGHMDMGPLGKYEFLWSSEKRFMHGAIMRAVNDEPSHWLFYFRVANIDAAHRAILDAGGTIYQEPQEIPGGDFSLIALDPEGVHFGLVGARES